jgi:hypothetical protein
VRDGPLFLLAEIAGLHQERVDRRMIDPDSQKFRDALDRHIEGRDQVHNPLSPYYVGDDDPWSVEDFEEARADALRDDPDVWGRNDFGDEYAD